MTATCTACGGKHYAKGFCRRHYYAQPEWKSYHSRIYEANKEARKVASRLNYAANKDRVAASRKAWAVANPEKVEESRRAWVEANPQRARAITRAVRGRRNAAKRRAIPAWADKERIAEVYRRAAAMGLEVDHVVPLRSPLVCGLHVWENLQLLARPLNNLKGNRSWPDMPEGRP